MFYMVLFIALLKLYNDLKYSDTIFESKTNFPFWKNLLLNFKTHRQTNFVN